MSREIKPYDRIERTCAAIAEYNKEHGTNYSYGEYTAMVRMKKIRPATVVPVTPKLKLIKNKK